jgi:hypothetical protein
MPRKGYAVSSLVPTARRALAQEKSACGNSVDNPSHFGHTYSICNSPSTTINLQNHGPIRLTPVPSGRARVIARCFQRGGTEAGYTL